VKALLLSFSWQELRHHPWRNAAAVVAVMLGVALAFSVQLINTSALDEFASAVRSVNGQPDLELRAAQGSFDESVFALVAQQPQVRLASPVLELQTLARLGDRQLPVRVVGVDALTLPTIAPSLVPQPSPEAERFSILAPGQLFLNAAARKTLGDAARSVELQADAGWRPLQVAGEVAAGGTALAVMDIGAAQDLFGRGGQLTRIDLRLAPGTDHAAFIKSLAQAPGWPPGIQVAEPGDSAERVNDLSRAYRVNLTVLALVALFTGAFLVFSVLALSVAKRAQQFALLGVLGLTPRERRRLVLAESLLLGLAGSAAGLVLGTGLAEFALEVLGGDLGGGYFEGVAPTLRWSWAAAGVYGALGVLAAGIGGWWPARSAEALPEAQTLKGLGAAPAGAGTHVIALLLLGAGAALAAAPAVFGIPIAAYLSVGLLLVGGISALPWLIALVYDRLAPWFAGRLLPLLAIERARRMRGTAAVAVSGVVASLSLAVALTVMVASFRDSVTRWLDVVLPADLYLHSESGSNAAGNEAPGRPRGENQSTAGRRSSYVPAVFTPALVQAFAQLPGVARTGTLRTRPLLLDPARPPVTLIARTLDGDPGRALPLMGPALPVPAGQVGIFVSEAMVELYGARPGMVFEPLARAWGPLAGGPPVFFVAGVWRDYVRQFGAVTMDARDFERLTGDASASDLALWLAPGASEAQVQQEVRALADRTLGSPESLDIASVAQIRASSLRVFDRSFAVTYWLQAVAIAIGLFGIAASFSAQVLARRKEFGLLAHLGFTRRQVLAVVAGEGAAWTAIGAIAGLGLGLAVSLVLVKVVNPQSFHWTMDLLIPWLRLAALCAAVIAAGTLTAWLAGARRGATRCGDGGQGGLVSMAIRKQQE
jgi:putative ABC transport system permease protein